MTGIVWLLSLLLLPVFGFSSTDFPQDDIKKSAIPGEYILELRMNNEMQNIFSLSQQLNISFLEMYEMKKTGAVQIILSRSFKSLSQVQAYKTLVFVNRNKIDSWTWKKISDSPQLEVIHANYLYEGEMREEVTIPNDEKFREQYHHPVMKNTEAWDFLGNRQKVIIAVTDDGVDLDHQDLRDNIWTNTAEIPGNGVDDDSNGYIDDFQGWDFADRDNDPRPTYGSHGTHVSGIIAASVNNRFGVVGTAAPVAQIMPLRFYGGSFTSQMVAETYRYAADNGAQIITTSYNIDYFVGDPVFAEAIAYVYDKGVIHFNSAGNGYSSAPARKAFQELILVCSTIADGDSLKNDQKSDFSNYGPGIDLCAPGGGGGNGILSTIPYDRYGRKDGTSMATPNAAAVAALIWAKNPHWTRDQVVAKLFSSSENIDSRNPNLKGQLGYGRVNSYLALANSDINAPQVQLINEIKNQKAKEGVSSLSIRFNQLLDPRKVRGRSFGLFGPDGEIAVNIARGYKIGSNEVLLGFEKLGIGEYELHIRPSLQNPFGQELDGNNDGQPGGERIIHFIVE